MIKRTLKCVVVDDEEFAVKILAEYIKAIPQLELVQSFTDPLLALSEIFLLEKVDILFLDINMPEISGVELASKMRRKVKHLIFTTSHPEFALQAFGVKANDYLLKPIDRVKFIETVNVILEQGEMVRREEDDDILFIKPGGKGKFTRVKLEDIILIHAEHNNIKINTHTESFGTLDTMKNLTEFLSKDTRFLRIHKSYIINKTKILSVEGNTVHLMNKWTALVGEQFRASFMKFIDGKLLRPDRGDRA